MGLCRMCQRELGDTRSMQDYERERVERQQEAAAALERVDPTPRPRPTRIINGVEYVVTFDGT